MKSKKLISALLTASLTFSVIPGCIMAEEVNTPVDETISIIDSYELVDHDTVEELYSFLDTLPSEDTKEVLDNSYEHTDLEVAKAAYDNLKARGANVHDDVIQSQFNNVLAYSLYPMGLTDVEYEYTVGVLAGTLEPNQNPFSCYYPIAMASHLITCDETHSVNEFGKGECPVILGYWDEVGTKSTEDMLDEMFIGDEAYLRIKTAMSLSGKPIDVYLTELERFAELSKKNTDIHDDQLWLELFGNLDATLGAEESLYEVYIVLAIKIHNMKMPDEPMEIPDFLELTRD